ncbi:cache domain-containing protein [Halanaerobium saccharolyticum]|uniref:cache domain-containing protein n=1 Tax=Halanaerobium saccharolyticum TaxID=43595 RepID=UPI003FCC98A4
MFFKNLSIAKKIFLVIGLSFLVLVLIMGYFLNYQFNKLSHDNTETVSRYLLDSEKERIQHATETAAGFMEELVAERENNLSLEELTSLIRTYNQDLEFGEVGYFFIYDFDGNTVSLPPTPEIEGTNRWNLQDANGKYILRSLVEAAKSGGSFVDYIYANPDTGEEENKISYVAPIEGTNYLIGAGTYAGIINSEVSSVQNELDSFIANISSSLLIFAVITALIFALVIFFISRYIAKNINKDICPSLIKFD